jgi:hypothetical protein
LRCFNTLGKSGVESLTVRPILPLNGGSGCGNTSCPNVTDGNPNNRKQDKNIAAFDMRVSSANE